MQKCELCRHGRRLAVRMRCHWRRVVVRKRCHWQRAAVRKRCNWRRAVVRKRCHWHQAVVRKRCHWRRAVVRKRCHWHQAVVRKRCHWRRAVIRKRCHWKRTVVRKRCHWQRAAVLKHSHWPVWRRLDITRCLQHPVFIQVDDDPLSARRLGGFGWSLRKDIELIAIVYVEGELAMLIEWPTYQPQSPTVVLRAEAGKLLSGRRWHLQSAFLGESSKDHTFCISVLELNAHQPSDRTGTGLDHRRANVQ
jgi:hypothetical protein